MKTILVTGSTDGIGKEAANYYLKKGHYVIIHGRNKEKIKRVVNELHEKTREPRISWVYGDFASFQSVVKMASYLLETYEQLDVLVNNAATLTWRRTITEDGNELVLQVNHLSPVLLTLHLLPLLKKNAKHHVNDSRIINVSSMIHASSIDFSNLQSERGYSPYSVYSLTKLCNLFFTFELAERLINTGISVNAIHPGVLNTKLLREYWGGGHGTPLSHTLHYVTLSPELKGITGKYFEDRRITEPHPIARDPQARKQCWEKTINLIKPFLPENSIITL